MKKTLSKSVSRITTSDKNDSVCQATVPQGLRTKRDSRIMRLYDDGYTPAEIAALLGLPERVIRYRVALEIAKAA